jgi:hypothetical protein
VGGEGGIKVTSREAISRIIREGLNSDWIGKKASHAVRGEVIGGQGGGGGSTGPPQRLQPTARPTAAPIAPHNKNGDTEGLIRAKTSQYCGKEWPKKQQQLTTQQVFHFRIHAGDCTVKASPGVHGTHARWCIEEGTPTPPPHAPTYHTHPLFQF